MKVPQLSVPRTLLLSSAGIVMGLATALIGLSPLVEQIGWFVAAAVWIVAAGIWQPSSAFWTALTASIAASMWASLIQIAFFDAFVANNPWRADALAGGSATRVLVLEGLAVGLGFGLLCGLAAMRIRSRVRRAE